MPQCGDGDTCGCVDRWNPQFVMSGWENCKIYLPSSDDGMPIDEEIQRYVQREFPRSDDVQDVRFYSIPRTFVGHGEEQGSLAEYVCHERFRLLGSPQDGSSSLWVVCFQGISYAGRSNKSGRGGKIMTREHDLVVFTFHDGKYYASLVEVKSTCDNPSIGYKVSDAISVKNNKRSGQHQLRDHIEILASACSIPEESLQRYLFWPFLSSWTTDPRGQPIRRWEKETDLHVFTDVLSDQTKFDDWFFKTILKGRPIDVAHFDVLFKRFIVLSCGIFVDEIHKGMLALLSQEQVSLMHTTPPTDGSPTIVHGAAGTGKTLLILHKLNYLHQNGLLDDNNRALYICYWPGIRADFRTKLKELGMDRFVDTTRFFISREDFMEKNRKKYRHIYMDESEAICLAFNELIVSNTLENIKRCRLTDYDEDFYSRQNNNNNNNENPPQTCYGDLWYMVDINQATLFIPKFSPTILKKPTVSLSKVMRSTGTIYKVFSQFYKNPLPTIKAATKLSDMYLSNIVIGHDIAGPPIYWVNSNSIEPSIKDSLSNKTFNGMIRVIIDLYSSKGIKPNDMCVLPFFVTHAYLPDNVNKAVSDHFVANGYQPTCISRVEEFLMDSTPAMFLMPWVLRVKGLEFKVVVIAIDSDDFDLSDPEDRRKIYVMASRCTCLLIIVCAESIKESIDVLRVMRPYSFGIDFA